MICSVSQQTCAEHPLPCPEHMRRKLVNRQTGFRPPGAHRPNSGRGKLLMIYNDLFYLFTGLGMKGTWYKYLRWLGYSAGEWGRKEKSGLHGELFEMVLLCHLSIRSLDLAYGPRLILPPTNCQEAVGAAAGHMLRHLSFGFSRSFKAINQGSPGRFLYPLLAPVCPNLQWVHSETLLRLYSSITEHRPVYWGSAQRTNDEKV